MKKETLKKWLNRAGNACIIFNIVALLGLGYYLLEIKQAEITVGEAGILAVLLALIMLVALGISARMEKLEKLVKSLKREE